MRKPTWRERNPERARAWDQAYNARRPRDKAKRAAWARERYARKRDYINAQRRALYAVRLPRLKVQRLLDRWRAVR